LKPMSTPASNTTSPGFSAGSSAPANPQVKTNAGAVFSIAPRNFRSEFLRPMPVTRIFGLSQADETFRNGAASSGKAKQTSVSDLPPPVARLTSLDSTQPLLPNLVQQHGSFHVAQTIFGDFPKALFREQIAHVHSRNAVAFGRFNAEGLAIKIQIELSRGAIAAAHVVKGQLLRQVAMRFGLIAVAEPVLARNRHVENGRAKVNEGHIEAPAIEGHDGVVMFRHVPKRGEQFRFVRAWNKFHR